MTDRFPDETVDQSGERYASLLFGCGTDTINFMDQKRLSRLVAGNRAAATKIGITLKEYLSWRKAGFAWCSRCRKWLTQTRFYKDKRGRKRNGYCKICHNEFRKLREQEKKDVDKLGSGHTGNGQEVRI